jgi:hypothetical protein
MKNAARRDSGRLMLISPERVFYAGLLGRPRQRISGGFNFYATLQGSLTVVAGGSERSGEFAVLPPYAAHSIASEFPSIICVAVEPETVEPSAIAALLETIGASDGPAFVARARAAYYPDSTHFSHSIRRFYGLQPRAIFSGSRDLAIYRSRATSTLKLAAQRAAGHQPLNARSRATPSPSSGP